MFTDNLFDQFISHPAVHLVVKIGILFALVLYAIFSLIIVRQVEIMMRVLIVPVVPIFRVVIFIHVVLSLLVFIFALIVI